MSDKSCGFLMFAQNNTTINYLKIALTNALLIKKHLNKPVSVVTDTVSLSWAENVALEELIYNTFDEVIIKDVDNSFINSRQYRDTIYHEVIDNFNNSARASAYNLSPYEETILIDADYLVFDNTLNNVWGCSEDFLINKDAIDLNWNLLDGDEYRLHDTGIRMYWATCVYFKKCERANLLFDMVEHIRNYWSYYQLVYDFPGTLFRNDFAFAIAIHTLSGFIENDDFKSLPTSKLLTVLDSDQVFKYLGDDAVLIFVHNKIENWKFEIVKIQKMSIHFLNKISLMPLLDSIIKDAQNV